MGTVFGRVTLGNLIEWLEQQDQNLIVKDGFGDPHSDRGDYSELAFDPVETAKIADMLAHAKSAVGSTYTGWKGGCYEMDADTNVYIGEYGDCGEPITTMHFKYWLSTAS